MAIESQPGQGAARHLWAVETVPAADAPDRGRPHVSGDLPSVLQAGPMFRRAVAGYDRFQVDTYVQWAEDELAAADRERDRLLAIHLGTRAALEEARELLSHSAEGAEFLGSARRIGSMLAAAADEAQSMRAEAEAHRSAACAQAEDMAARSERLLADATTEAGRLLADAATEAGRMVAAAVTEVEKMAAEAGRIGAAAAQTTRAARAEAASRLESVRVIEERAAEQAERIRRQAMEEALASRQQARDELIQMMSTGRDERRRADAEAAATRERQDRDAAARRAALMAEVADLEHRRVALRLALAMDAVPVLPSSADPHPHLRGYLKRLQHRLQHTW
jgi:hypothetical protein